MFIENERIDHVNEPKYLGRLITNDGTTTKEIRSRISQAKNAFNKNKSLFISHGIDMKIRKKLIKTVWSALLYESEAWTVGKAEETRLLAFQAWCWRRRLGTSWREHMTHEEFLDGLERN